MRTISMVRIPIICLNLSGIIRNINIFLFMILQYICVYVVTAIISL
jgi:hypothetical protein